MSGAVPDLFPSGLETYEYTDKLILFGLKEVVLKIQKRQIR